MATEEEKAIFIDIETGELVFQTLDESKPHLDMSVTEKMNIEENEAITGYQFLLPALGVEDWDGHIYISGATGSGKTFIINKLIMNDRRKRTAYLISNIKEKDPTYEEAYNNKRLFLVVDEPAARWQISTTKLKRHIDHSLLIFDDIDDTNWDARHLRDKALERGRHQDIVVICVNHKLREHEVTKKPLNESRYLIAFPSSNRGAINGFMKDRMEMEPKARRLIIKQSIKDGRHLTFHKFHPNMIATTKSVFKI